MAGKLKGNKKWFSTEFYIEGCFKWYKSKKVGYIMSSLATYINIIKNRIITVPFILGILLGIALLFFEDMEYFSIIIILVCSRTMDKNKFRILSILQIKTKDIIKIPYISSYISTFIVHLILIASSIFNEEGKIVIYLTTLTVSIVIMNIIIPVIFISEMAVDDSGGASLVIALLMLVGLAINYGIIDAFNSNVFITIIINVLLVYITTKLSYKFIVNNVYGKS